MLQFTYKLKVTDRVKGKCSRHPRYNPEKDGRAGIRGACSCCFSLYDLYQARVALDAAQREFIRRAAPWVRPREPRRATTTSDAESSSELLQVVDHSTADLVPERFAPVRNSSRPICKAELDVDEASLAYEHGRSSSRSPLSPKTDCNVDDRRLSTSKRSPGGLRFIPFDRRSSRPFAAGPSISSKHA